MSARTAIYIYYIYMFSAFPHLDTTSMLKYVNEAAAEYGVALARAAGSCSGDEDLKAILEVPRLRRQA